MIFNQNTLNMAASVWLDPFECATVFTALLRHSFVPQHFRQSFLVPIIKDKRGDVTNMDNYGV